MNSCIEPNIERVMGQESIHLLTKTGDELRKALLASYPIACWYRARYTCLHPIRMYGGFRMDCLDEGLIL